MKISVIIPCYNTGIFLRDTLESLINQTYKKWEAIIVNDGSTDNTEEIAIEYTNKDPRFKYKYQKNKGLSQARNTGLDIASGDFIQLLDSDDVIAKNKFEKSIAFGNNYDIIDYHTLLTKWDLDFTFPPHCCLISSKIIKNTKFINHLKAKEDWVFWLDLFKKKPKVKYINEKLVFYRIHENNMTKNYRHMNENLSLACNHIYKNLENENKELFFNRIVNDYTTEKSKADYLYSQTINNLDGSIEKSQLNRIKKAITYKTVLKLELFLRGIKKIRRTPK